MESDGEFEPESIIEAVKCAENNIIPETSNIRYKKAYDDFLKWKTLNCAKSDSEDVLLAYFFELSKKWKPTSIWANYSMVKTMMKLYDKIDISSYHKLTAFLKKNSVGYMPVKATVFSEAEIHKFISDAADFEWLDVKVVCIFGICGALRTDEISRIVVADVKNHGNYLLVHIPQTKTKVPRSFAITGKFFDVVQKYAGLRVPRTVDRRFFVNYRAGKCTIQPIGKNKFSKMPQRIATYLKLADSQKYTGHSFRRTSASTLANSGASIERIKKHGGWRSSKVAEGYIEDSIHYKKTTGNLITSTITLNMMGASQGSMPHVADDIACVEIPDFSSADKIIEDTINPLRAMDPLVVDKLENYNDQLLNKEKDFDTGALKSALAMNQLQNQSAKNSFNFSNCSINFHFN